MLLRARDFLQSARHELERTLSEQNLIVVSPGDIKRHVWTLR